jgi:hypothetical protein
MRMPRPSHIALAVTMTVAAALPATAGVIRVNEGAFVAGSGLITFSEFGLGTVNPTYTPANYGGGVGSPTVTFDGYFTGQSLGAGCGGAASGCVVGSPTANTPLSLDTAAPDTRIVTDNANPTSPVLSGTPTFNGPIAILFSTLQAGVGLVGGFFNAVGGTAITAFGANGELLGSVTNTGLGIEFLGLVTDDGTAQIQGLLFSLVGPEPAGFAIDNLRFGLQGQVVVPEPMSMALFGLGLIGLAAVQRARRQSQA